MKKSLQHFLFVFIFFLACFKLSAQSEMRREIITPLQKNNNVSGLSTKKSDSISVGEQSQKSGVNTGSNELKVNTVPIDGTKSMTFEIDNKDIPTIKKDGSLRKAKTPEQLNKSADEIKAENIDAPLFPDFQVTATKEESYDNTQELKESIPQQLQKLERVPSDELQAEATNVNEKVTISASKRKYLEGLVPELEKEIKAGKRTSVEIQAKKKELEDLKKYLAQ